MKHVVLIVTDDPSDTNVLRGLVESMGNIAWPVATLDAARDAAAKRGCCCVVLDAGTGRGDGVRPRGERKLSALEDLRARDDRRNAEGHHVLPIVVVMAAGATVEEVEPLFLQGANGVITKPLVERRESLARKIDACLRRAGRGDHAACTGVAVDVASRVVHLALTGERSARGTRFRVNGEPADMQNGRFVVLLRFAVAHQRSRGAWSSRHQLGITKNPEIPSRIRTAFKGKVPEGYPVIESDWVGSFRLNPDIAVEIDLAELEKHPYAAVQKIVKEENELRARKARKKLG